MSSSNPTQQSTDTHLHQRLPTPHPPRLQHSPSLPNIWFPPHSGPIPPQLSVMSRDGIHLLSAPDSSSSHKSSLSLVDLESKDPPHENKTRPHVKVATHSTGRRQRVEAHSAHKLLTPPITPSSSIRSTASIDSTAPSIGDSASVSQEVSTDIDDDSPSRFLLISNIAPDVPEEVLQGAIAVSLSATNLEHHRSNLSLPTPVTPSVDSASATSRLSVPACKSSYGQTQDNPVKGLFRRCLAESGIIFLALHDLRDAIAAKGILSSPSTGVLEACVGQGQDAEGKRWLDCQFVTADKLVKMLGHSTFLKSMEAGFHVTVEENVSLNETIRGLRIVDDIEGEVEASSEVHAGDRTGRAFNIMMLEKILVAYGAIRSLTPVMSSPETCETNRLSRTFRVEYYDIRDSSAAYTALNGQVLFGMKLKVFGRDDVHDHPELDQVEEASDQAGEHTNIIPFPISSAKDEPQPFSTAGQLSQTRERFLFPAEATSNSESDNQRELPAFVASDIRSGSPPYFYSTSLSEPPSNTTHDDSTRPNTTTSTHAAADTIPTYVPLPQQRLVQTYYGGPSEGYAFPAQEGVVPVQSTNYSPYYAAATPPSPVPFPGVGHQHQMPGHFIGPAPAPGNGNPYENDPQMLQAINMGVAPWTFEGGTYNGVGIYHPAGFPIGMSPAPNAEYQWIPGMMPVGYQNGGPYFSAQPQQISRQPYLLPRQGDKNLASPPQNSRNGASTPPYLVRNPPTISATTTSNKEPPANNQLNLEKIENGQDTRTTVMIKNIPNKMSDKDLMAYIAKVCPRRIDFLYLRMDFKNGCNVGYAFVNFITVQDLLLFAKKRLGQKWNMFSSEKVLQMSYANYQGKEALVEKFKNSCIMDEREAWQPKIFYSEPGPEQGLPEPFPAATHQRRKERSSHNRGTLYVPGSNSLQAPSMPFGRRHGDHGEQRRSDRTRRQRTILPEHSLSSNSHVQKATLGTIQDIAVS